MLPWGHLGVAYLVYSTWVWRRHGQAPQGAAVGVVIVASQGPDLIDKPLAWTLDVLPGGRTLGHSLFVFALLAWLAVYYGRRHHADLAGAAIVGYGSHLAADLPLDLPLGNVADARYLLWPVLPAPPAYPEGIIPFLIDVAGEPYAVVQVGILAVAGIVWWRDGRPGIAHVGRSQDG